MQEAWDTVRGRGVPGCLGWASLSPRHGDEPLPPRGETPVWRPAGRATNALGRSRRSGRGRFFSQVFLLSALSILLFPSIPEPDFSVSRTCCVCESFSRPLRSDRNRCVSVTLPFAWQGAQGATLRRTHAPALPLAWRLSGAQKGHTDFPAQAGPPWPTARLLGARGQFLARGRSDGLRGGTVNARAWCK